MLRMPDVWFRSWRTVARRPGSGKDGQEFSERIVEGELSFVRKEKHRRRRKLLRQGADRVDGVDCRGHAVLEVREPERPLRENGFSSAHGEGDPGGLYRP